MPRNTTPTEVRGFEIYLLDMGQEPYGDSILCVAGDRTILIDGGHAGDWRSRNGYPSIPQQWEAILGHGEPFRVNLLVVTHCHSDHIGCLPTLVKNGTLTAEWALVADERMGFGRAADYVPPDTPSVSDRLAAMLREEDHTNLGDEDLADFLTDVATLEQRYDSMLEELANAGTQVVRYGRDDYSNLESAFADFGMKVLGPSPQQLSQSAEAIGHLNDRAPDFVTGVADVVVPQRMVGLYREIVKNADAVGAADQPGKGAALNDQSIVLKLNMSGSSVLMAGDMQFAVPEVTGLETLMPELLNTVNQAGPYQFIKFSHHASYNGFNANILQDWAATNFYAHSGGTNDASHPDRGVLSLLEANASRLSWARTDRNGRITVDFSSGQPAFTISRGELNDATPNGDVAVPLAEEAGKGPAVPVVVRRTEKMEDGLTEVTASAKIGPETTRLTITFDISKAPVSLPPKDQVVRPLPLPPPRPLPRMPKLAGGRRLPKLLFVTRRSGLENNLGKLEAQAALQMVRDAGQTVLEIPNFGDPYAEVQKALGKDIAGVVILGGYDILPARRLDALPASLRAQLGNTTSDLDNFIVWNDEAYGDRDLDKLPEVPVSRIPDAKSPRLVMAALAAGNPPSPPVRFGVRNSARPFAAGPYALLPGNATLLVSAPTTPTTIGAGNARGSHVYLMLHGSDVDATRFWGEDGSGTVEAVNISDIPRALAGMVFTGCCWGALTVQTTAMNYVAGQPLGVRTPGASIALSYLHAGAKAFVGCTGTHYSPTVPPYEYFGGPMHEAFWKRYTQGMGPAEALFHAKIDYAQGLPHGQTSPTGQAIEYKIWKQYTCLGLGW